MCTNTCCCGLLTRLIVLCAASGSRLDRCVPVVFVEPGAAGGKLLFIPYLWDLMTSYPLGFFSETIGKGTHPHSPQKFESIRPQDRSRR